MLGYKEDPFYIQRFTLQTNQWCCNGITSLANAFLSCHEKNWLNSCPQGFKQVCYRRYVDNIFVLFKSNDYLKYFQEFLNSCHINMSFSIETERQNKFYFLDIEVIRE